MKKHNDIQQLGQAVHELRTARGLSIRGLAARAGVDATWLMRLERGLYRSPDARLLRQLAEVLEVPTSDLLLEAGFENPSVMPSIGTYLRTKYELPDEAVAQLEAHFRLLDEKYGGQETEENAA